MNHRGWFTLVIRAIGVLLCAFALPSVVAGIVAFGVHVVDDWNENSLASFVQQLLMRAYGMTTILAELAIGLYLFLGGRWLIDRCLREAERLEREAGAPPSDSAGL